MTMPAGNYYVGDLCYVLHNAWDEFCDKLDHQGENTLKDGRRYAWYHTASGDGCYQDQYGREYGVDAGLIGCILLSDIEKDEPANDPQLGHIVEFGAPFEISYDNGKIHIGHIVIDTDPDDWPDEDEEDIYGEDY